MKRALLRLLRPGSAAAGSIGLQVLPDGVAPARIAREGGVARLTHCEYRALPPSAEPAFVLRGLLATLGADAGGCNLVLSPDEYQALLVETPDVPASELREAVRWRIHDLVDIPLDDATIDVFDMPQQISHGEEKPRMLCVVISRSPLIAAKAALVNRTGASLAVIDIAELSLRNLTALLPEDQAGVVVLHLERDYCLVVVTRDATLYLSRRLAIGLQTLLSDMSSSERAGQLQAHLDLLIEEVYRSLEYCQRRFSNLVPAAVILTPSARLVRGLREGLAESVGVPVRSLDLDSILPDGIKVPADRQAMCLLAVGAALRTESTTL